MQRHVGSIVIDGLLTQKLNRLFPVNTFKAIIQTLEIYEVGQYTIYPRVNPQW